MQWAYKGKWIPVFLSTSLGITIVRILLTASFYFSISTASRQCWNQCIISVQLDEMLNKLRMKINSLFYLYVKGNTVLWCSWWSLSFRLNIWVPAITPDEWDFVLCVQQEILSCPRLPAFTFRNTGIPYAPSTRPLPAPHSVIPGIFVIMSTGGTCDSAVGPDYEHHCTQWGGKFVLGLFVRF